MNNICFTQMNTEKKKIKKKKNLSSPKICRGINKNNKPCKYKSKYTIYCNKHTELVLDKIVKIQKWWKNTLQIINFKRRGIGYNHLYICNNTEDFYTLQDLSEIPNTYLITYFENETKKVWAFDLRSLYNLFVNSKFNAPVLNPYTTIPFNHTFVRNVNNFIYSYKNNTDFKIKDQESEVVISREEHIIRKCVDCFIQINSLGYHCNHKWITDLSKHRLIRLFYEFKDIITYRASLSRNQIIGIFGTVVPFSELLFGIEYKSTYELLELICNKIKMIFETNSEHKELGILLFLTALTTVSNDANQSLNFLQQSNFY